MDPAQNTVDDLMLRICHIENVGNSKGVCLYTVDGMPLTDDPFFNTCKNSLTHFMRDGKVKPAQRATAPLPSDRITVPTF